MKHVIPVVLCLAALCLADAEDKAPSAKRGIGYGYHQQEDLVTLSKGGSWWYNWHILPDGAVRGSYQETGVEFVPMVWGGEFDEAALRAFLDTHRDVKWLLGFNEPNFRDQANLTPQQAAERWPILEKIAEDYNLGLVGPAVNYCGNCVEFESENRSDPVAYLDAFFEACKDCRVDAVAVHTYMCYGGALNWYLDQFTKYGKPLWVTEFACWENNPRLDDQKRYMQEALDVLEGRDDVFRYAWFIGRRDPDDVQISIYGDEPGSLTELGELYLGE